MDGCGRGPAEHPRGMPALQRPYQPDVTSVRPGASQTDGRAYTPRHTHTGFFAEANRLATCLSFSSSGEKKAYATAARSTWSIALARAAFDMTSTYFGFPRMSWQSSIYYVPTAEAGRAKWFRQGPLRRFRAEIVVWTMLCVRKRLNGPRSPAGGAGWPG